MVSPDISNYSLTDRGLTSAQVILNRSQYGSNVLTPPLREPWWKLYLAKFSDPVIRILIIAASIAFSVGIIEGDYSEGLGILLAIIIATTLAFFNEYKASQEFQLLNQVYDLTSVKVIRDGNFTKVSHQDLVVGDIVYVEQGEEVPADGDILDAVLLTVDQSKITGEAKPVKKLALTPDNSPYLGEETYSIFKLYRSTIIVQGHVFFKVTTVGDQTEIGQLAQAVSSLDSEQQTPLNIQLDNLSKLIGIVGLIISSLTFIALLCQGFITGKLTLNTEQIYLLCLIIITVITALTPVWLPILDDGFNSLNLTLKCPKFIKKYLGENWLISLGLAGIIFLFGIFISYLLGFLVTIESIRLPQKVEIILLNYFMVAVTIIVVAVPEGLAMSVTLSLAYSMRKMAACHNLVRRMHACETIGSATVICADKTGTLTENKMKVEAFDFPCFNEAQLNKNQVYSNLVYEGIAVNSTADLERKPHKLPSPIGNITEGALLLWLDSQNIDYMTYRNQFKMMDRKTFSTENKYMITVGNSSIIEGNILYIKGAPEVILSYCSHQLTPQGIKPLFDANYLLQTIHNYQEKAMRVLGFAYHPLTKDITNIDIDSLNKDLIWLGFVVISDPLRSDAKSSIEACLKAGIKIKLVTGDGLKTAQEIAQKVNIYTEYELLDNPYIVLTGQQFNQLNDQQAKEAVKSLKVLARATPFDKLRLVKLLQENGEVVAVTGDGTNDAAALKQAQVGLAMGSGTAIAKEASDIILLDDSFKSIVNAVMWGRSLYENIQRFLLFQLTINVVALGIALLGPFIGVALPLTVTQMLWINLIMDTFAALALATEPPHWTVMKNNPRHPQDFIILPQMIYIILTTGISFLVFLVGFLAYLQQDGRLNIYELSVFFAVFVLLQFWNLFNARCFGLQQWAGAQLSENKAFLGIAALIFFGQIIIIQWGGKVFRTVPLSWQHWIIIILGTSLVLWLGELNRFRTRHQSSDKEN